MATTATRESVREELTAMLSAVKRRDVRDELARDDDFMRVLRLDSLDAVELTTQIGERYGIEFGSDPADLDALDSFSALVELVLRRATR